MMLTTTPSQSTPREIAIAIDEVRRDMDDLTARRAVSTDPGERIDLVHALQLAARRLAALEEQLSGYERRSP
jgi:hypothetical protein